jgi:hypothetical protein
MEIYCGKIKGKLKKKHKQTDLVNLSKIRTHRTIFHYISVYKPRIPCTMLVRFEPIKLFFTLYKPRIPKKYYIALELRTFSVEWITFKFTQESRIVTV